MELVDSPEPGEFAESRGAQSGELARIAGHLNVLHAELVAATERMLETGDWQQGGNRTPESFLAWKLGLSPERAKVVVHVARRRSEFPTIMAAFDRGSISLEQVAEAVKAPAWADEQIAHFVHIATPSKIRRAMRSNMFEGDPDEPDPDPAPVRDRLSFGTGRNGRWRISGELGVEEGRRIEAALTERKDALFDEGHEDVTWPDALVDCFDRSLGAIESASRRDHYRTWIHLDVTSGDATTTDGWRIPMAVEQHLVCDGVVQPVWERDGVPFSVGRTQRIVPERTRRIVEQRDRGCRVPGCTCQFVEIHHIVHWLDGGPTDTWNLVSLCRWHHKLHHRGRLGVSGNADEFGGLLITDESGEPIEGCGRPEAPTGPPPSRAEPFRGPLTGRFDWNWIGLGWIHPNAVKRNLEQLERTHRAAS